MDNVNSLEEAIKVIKQMTNIINDESENSFVTRHHHTLGRKMRNAWGLWGGGALRTEITKLGLTHPDDMSSLILQCAYRDKKGLDRDIPSIVSYYQNYWSKLVGQNLTDPSDKGREPGNEEDPD